MSLPLTFRLGQVMVRRRIRGGFRLLALTRRLWPDATEDFALSDSLTFTVPIGRADSCWDLRSLKEYEHEFISSFCNSLEGLSDVTLFDCGADIGLVSASVCVRSPAIVRVLAFEPNSIVHNVLARNIARLPGGAMLPVAVADFDGAGQLMQPDYDPKSEHARYLKRADSGFPVMTIDSLGIRGGNIAIKIDVEGGEMAVVRGASETIRSATAVVVAFESNREVIARTGIDPLQCMALLSELAPFRFKVAETNAPLTLQSREFQTQAIVNVIATTVASSPGTAL